MISSGRQKSILLIVLGEPLCGLREWKRSVWECSLRIPAVESLLLLIYRRGEPPKGSEACRRVTRVNAQVAKALPRGLSAFPRQHLHSLESLHMLLERKSHLQLETPVGRRRVKAAHDGIRVTEQG